MSSLPLWLLKEIGGRAGAYLALGIDECAAHLVHYCRDAVMRRPHLHREITPNVAEASTELRDALQQKPSSQWTGSPVAGAVKRAPKGYGVEAVYGKHLKWGRHGRRRLRSDLSCAVLRSSGGGLWPASYIHEPGRILPLTESALPEATNSAAAAKLPLS